MLEDSRKVIDLKKDSKSHWEREKHGIFTKADIRHEKKEPFGWEVKEHGLTIREAEHALMGAQKKKYGGNKKSRFHL
jgi:hypothetical protein